MKEERGHKRSNAGAKAARAAGPSLPVCWLGKRILQPSEASQGSDMCPVLISVFINDSKDGEQRTLITLGKPARQEEAEHLGGQSSSLQTVLDKLEK